MDGDDVSDALELLDRRYRFLECIESGPAHVRDLTAALGVSRSTVNRGVRELTEAGWIARTDEGYVLTTAGSLVLDHHRDHLAGLRAVQSNHDLFDPIPPATPLEPAVLAGADITLSSSNRQYELLEQIHAMLDRATSLRALWPVAADDRSLSEVVGIAARGGSVTVAADPDIAERLQAEAETNGGVAQGSWHVESCDVLPRRLGVVDLVTDDERCVLLVVYSPTGGIHAVVENGSVGARRWADDLFRQYLGASQDHRLVDGPVGETGQQPVDELPESAAAPDVVTESGFRPLSSEYFEGTEVLAPATMLRAGPRLAEVRADMTLAREHVVDGDRRDFVADVLADVADGHDSVIIGLPGSGKSTCLKQAAYRWWHDGTGPVVYREAGRDAPIEDPTDLASALRAMDGHVLVAVEDATRGDVSRLFTLIQELSGDADVSFLLDSRRSEWADPDELLDARLETFRQDEIRPVSVPALDDTERDRFHAHVDRLLPGSLPPREEFTMPTWDDSDAEAGELLILSHRYGLFADPQDDRDAVTSLSQDVRSAYAAVADDPDALVVATLVNACNAAGLPVTPDLVYALAVDPDGPDLDAVDAALDDLDGHVLFGRVNGAYRTVHDAWSTAFLDEVVSTLDHAVAHRRFAGAVNALLALGGDPDRRDRIRSLRQGDAPVLEQVEADPVAWLTATAERLFSLGRETPGLAPLYGHGPHANLSFPDACPTSTVHSCLVARARMYSDAGDYEVALAECDYLEEVADATADENAKALLRARADKIRSYVWDRRGEFDDAWEYGLSSLEGFRAAGDRQGEARALNGVGVVAWLRGDVDEAKARFEAALDIYDEITDLRGEADVLNNLGMIQRERGDLDGAVERFEQSHEIRHTIGARVQALDSLINLGVTARDVGDLDAAIARFRQAVQESKTVGAREVEAHARRALGNTYRRAGDLGRSRESLERALEMTSAQENRHSQMLCLRGLAATACDDGRLDEAADHVEACLALVEELGDERDEALALAIRGRIAQQRGDLDVACEHLSSAIEMLESLDRSPGLAETYRDYASVCSANGVYEKAFDALDAAIERYESVGATPYLRETLTEAAEIAEAAGDEERVTASRERLEGMAEAE
ncbi:tetratricopeptide repeat protein [Haloarchaeobius amylolyticus]|uniref:tetratricopeptide repeat protein n=1 Tax=Haloarchaeobius amylolyticus TaxID=1198296 RepID=UPI00226F4C4F|nr:tetratricopeptide repeat protein [Haloarchaeobius amylolyticus]